MPSCEFGDVELDVGVAVGVAVVSCSVTEVSCDAEEDGVRFSGLLFMVTPERKRRSE